MSWEGIGVIVSLLGVLATWRHSAKSRRIAKKALQIEKDRREDEKEERERREKERKKADFTATVGKGVAPGWKPKSIAIRNTGQATARNIQISLQGEPVGESDHVVDGKAPKQSRLAPGDQPLFIPLLNPAQGPGHLTVKVVWDDEFGSDRSRKMTVQV